MTTALDDTCTFIVEGKNMTPVFAIGIAFSSGTVSIIHFFIGIGNKIAIIFSIKEFKLHFISR
eukprot:Awhi_evm1s14566